MLANFHTHTTRCHHAFGSEREYVEAAISAGMKVLGFSDHAPYCFPEGYYSRFRMFPEQKEEYLECIRSLKAEYSADIDIYVGYEIEYYPAYFNDTMKMLNEAPFDYLILGQHFVGNEIGAAASYTQSDNLADFDSYINNTVDGIRTGLFFCVAHPDLFGFTGSDRIYRDRMQRLCREAKNASVPLEINLLGIREGRRYPEERFFRIVSQVGNEVIIGKDAHSPDSLLRTDDIEAAHELIHKYKLNLIEPKTPFRRKNGESSGQKPVKVTE